MPDIGKRIKEKREYLGITQEELAQKLGYKNKSTIAKIENGTNDIVQSKVIEFAKALETSVAYLMGWEDNLTKTNTDLIVDMLSDKDLADHVAKLNILSKEHQQTIFDNIDYWYEKEGH